MDYLENEDFQYPYIAPYICIFFPNKHLPLKKGPALLKCTSRIFAG